MANKYSENLATRFWQTASKHDEINEEVNDRQYSGNAC